MLFNLLGTIIVGIAAAGTVMLAHRLFGRRPAGWMVPVAAGGAMLAFHIWNEYTWFERTADVLPDDVVVAQSYDYKTPFQPWTLLVPRINRFTALDQGSIRRNDKAPDYVMADVFLVKRLDPTAKVTQIYDCRGARRADVDPGSSVDERGLPVDAAWTDTDLNTPLFKLVCGST
ncbi:MAG: hypothetical protein ACR2QJ_03295 [Geminicoccaceae bacterium]